MKTNSSCGWVAWILHIDCSQIALCVNSLFLLCDATKGILSFIKGWVQLMEKMVHGIIVLFILSRKKVIVQLEKTKLYGFMKLIGHSGAFSEWALLLTLHETCLPGKLDSYDTKSYRFKTIFPHHTTIKICCKAASVFCNRNLLILLSPEPDFI